jgi:hypothetical protein
VAKQFLDLLKFLHINRIWRRKFKLMGNIYKMMSWQGILTSHKTQAGRNTQPQALQDVSVCMRERTGKQVGF